MDFFEQIADVCHELIAGDTGLLLRPFVAAADVITPTAEEARLLTGAATTADAVAALLEGNPHKVVILTQGADGCVVHTRGGAEHVPGFPVEEVDPTGAGDCFDAGFLATWLQGSPPAEAARFANACGALAVTVQGPMAGARKQEDVEAFMRGEV